MLARRGLYWLGVLLGTALLVTGSVVAAVGLTASDSPATVVRNYFAALARGDAPGALSYGDVPAGPRRLLTSAVLLEQQRIAPLTDLAITDTARHGVLATVSVRYVLGFPGAPVSASGLLSLHRTDGEWRLDRVAVATTIVPTTARQRLAVLGAAVPHGAVLLFPGALPLRLDTPYLELEPTGDYVSFGTTAPVRVPVQLSRAGRAAFRTAIRDGLHRCLTGSDDPACPLPTERYVPGSVRGAVHGALGGDLALDPDDPAGLLRYRGTPTITGSWRRLDFHNRVRHSSGRVLLDVCATAYATDPLRLHWTAG